MGHFRFLKSIGAESVAAYQNNVLNSLLCTWNFLLNSLNVLLRVYAGCK